MRRHAEIAGLPQEVELGYFARLDSTSGQQYRLAGSRAAVSVPQGGGPRRDCSATSGSTRRSNAQARAVGRAARRRAHRPVHLRRARQLRRRTSSRTRRRSTRRATRAACRRTTSASYREPVQRATTAGTIVLPRASLVLGPFAGLSPSAELSATACGRSIRRTSRRTRRRRSRRIRVVRGRPGVQGRRRRPRRRAPAVRVPHPRRSRSDLQRDRRPQRARRRHDPARRLAVGPGRAARGSTERERHRRALDRSTTPAC